MGLLSWLWNIAEKHADNIESSVWSLVYRLRMLNNPDQGVTNSWVNKALTELKRDSALKEALEDPECIFLTVTNSSILCRCPVRINLNSMEAIASTFYKFGQTVEIVFVFDDHRTSLRRDGGRWQRVLDLGG